MNKQEKNEMIAILDGMLKENNNFYLADISGLTAEENSALRRLCFKRDVSLQVVKNTLLKKAFEKNDADFSELYDVLVGNTSIMQAEAGNSPAKIIKEFRKKNEKPILKAAHVAESLYIGDENLSALADLKSKDELIGDIITLLQSPAKNVISALKSGGNQLSGIVKTLQEKTGEVPAVEEKVIQETPEVEEISAESQAEENPVAEVADEELEKEEVIEENPVAEETSDEPKSEEKDEENSSEEESKE